MYCDRQYDPTDAPRVIELVYFVRATVCNYLIEHGFNQPWQILLAQLHPVAFFGVY
jgi:hypothetical protein